MITATRALSRFCGADGRDFVFGASFLAGWIRRCPHAEVHRFEDAGHYLLEDAGVEVSVLVREFLSREGRPGRVDSTR